MSSSPLECDFVTSLMSEQIFPVWTEISVNQGRRKRYGRYGQGLTKISQILFRINHILFQQQLFNQYIMGAYYCTAQCIIHSDTIYTEILQPNRAIF